MKTKKFLMLMAAMLLSCASAFAQSGNNTPAKGDVNDDGTVDVADIVAVIDIMKNGGGTATAGYFYLGTTQPTAENYKTLPGVVNTYSSIDEAVGATASVAAGETVFMLCPAAWVSGKNVTLEDKTGNAIDFLEEKDATTISGYVIYKTQALNAPNDVVLKTQEMYYWYVGTTKPTSLSQATTVDSYPDEQLYTNNSGAKAHIFVLTNSDKNVTFINPELNAPVTQVDVDTKTIPGYKIFETAVGTANTKSIKIRIS